MKKNLKKIILEEILKVLEEETSSILYVNSKYAKLRDGITSSSKVLKTFNYGDKIQYLGQEKLGFLFVKDMTGLQGWIPKTLTSNSLPTKEEWAAQMGRESLNAKLGGITATTGARG
jgi:restriction endonuclease S subunit